MTEYDEKAITRLMDKFDLDRPEAEAMYAKTSEGPNTSYDGDPLKYEIAALEREGKSKPEEDDSSFLDEFMGIFSDEEEGETDEEKLLRELGGEDGIGASQETYAQEVEQPETEEERYRRQVDTFNGMRSHVSDSDEGYMQGQDPESLQRQASDQEMAQMVQALQKQAFERGQGGDAAQIPLGGNAGGSQLPQNPMDQQLRNMALNGGPAQQAGALQNTPPQPNLAEIRQLQQVQALKNIEMQRGMYQQQQGNMGGAGNFRPGY
jgi:hypothetical protein